MALKLLNNFHPLEPDFFRWRFSFPIASGNRGWTKKTNNQKIMKQELRRLLLLAGILGLAAPGVQAATTADIIFIVDESGSMGGEHTWLGGMVSSLDTALGVAGVTGNRYGLVGYGGHVGGAGNNGHQHSVGGGAFGTAGQLATAAGLLVTSGGTEDGYAAMSFALGNYTFRNDASIQFILVTDEDRDVTTATTKAQMFAALQAKGVLLNAVVDALINETPNTGVSVGTDGSLAYLADGSGGFTTETFGSYSGAAGTTVNDYSTLATATGGASWDLNQLRAGGNTAASFTKAFVDIKVQEVVQDVPRVPSGGSTLGFLSGSLALLGYLRRRLGPARS
jgi:hypothetical protein